MEATDNEGKFEKNYYFIDMYSGSVFFCTCRGRVWSGIKCVAGGHTGADRDADIGDGASELWVCGGRQYGK